MNKFLLILLSGCLLFSCNTEDRPYSYLCESDTGAETVELAYTVADVQSPFKYTFQAREMCIDWGDNPGQQDYIFTGENDSINTIKPISHIFSSNSDYNIKVKSLRLSALVLSRFDDNVITKLELSGCENLRSLYCENQPIPEIDVSHCPLLRELSCGYPEGTQAVSDLASINLLKILSVNGPLNMDNLNLTANDSLHIASFNNTNLGKVQFTELKELSSISFKNCESLVSVYLSNNDKLSKIVLANNTSLEAEALNDIFRSLSQAPNTGGIIVLMGNKGDATCDRSIATSKGWIFESSLN